jgi:hypothetical protein
MIRRLLRFAFPWFFALPPETQDIQLGLQTFHTYACDRVTRLSQSVKRLAVLARYQPLVNKNVTATIYDETATIIVAAPAFSLTDLGYSERNLSNLLILRNFFEYLATSSAVHHTLHPPNALANLVDPVDVKRLASFLLQGMHQA